MIIEIFVGKLNTALETPEAGQTLAKIHKN
jgi:hypothetical protein